MNNLGIYFNTHFISLDNNSYVFPKTLNFSSVLTTKSRLRVLETFTRRVNSDLESTSADNKKAEYSCQIQGDASNIGNIKLVPDDIFRNGKVNLSISPLALQYIDNLENIPNDDSYNVIFNAEKIYILKNAKYNKIYRLDFNITGQIENDVTTPLNNKKLKLNITKLSNRTDSADCTINHLSNSNYCLDCKLDDSEDCDLEGSYSLIDDDTLLYVNFGNNPSKITFNNTRYYYYKSSNKLSAGIIAVIVIVPIVVMAALISIILYFRKGHPIDVSPVNNTSNVGDNYNSSTKI